MLTKDEVKSIASRSVDLGDTPGAMCRAAVYLTQAAVARLLGRPENEAVLLELQAERVNQPPAVVTNARHA